MDNQSPRPEPTNTVATNRRYPFQTADGHNPEIIYHLMDGQATLDRRRDFNQLDTFLRDRGPSVELLTQDVEYFEDQTEYRATQAPLDRPRYEGEYDEPVHHDPNPWSDEEGEFYGPSGDQEPEIWEAPAPVVSEAREPSAEACEVSEENSGLEEGEIRQETGPEYDYISDSEEDQKSEIREETGPGYEYDYISDSEEDQKSEEDERSEEEEMPVLPAFVSSTSHAPPPTYASILTQAHANYVELLNRLRSRTSTSLSNDTCCILQRDYFHGASALCPAAFILRHMRSAEGSLPSIFDVDFDCVRRKALEQWNIAMPRPEWVINRRDCHLPGMGGGPAVTKIVLPHIYFPGWQGTPAVDVLKSTEWQRGVNLASGRYQYQTLVWVDDCDAPPLPECMTVLGFPNGQTFVSFIYRPEILEAFRELWDVCLKDIEPEYDELPARAWTRRPVALRIFYSRTLHGNCEFSDANPDKTGWGIACHLARFCLKVEKVCNRWMLPPMRGQIPLVTGKASCEVVAWGGIELARVLRRMQKNDMNKYLDDTDYAAFLSGQ